jgi:6-pyruvoyl-tetrahydropterin synthase
MRKISFSLYMAQHVLYINGIQKSLDHKTIFTHKKPTECAFGKMFYAEIKPNLENFSIEKQSIIKTVEETHIAFHEIAFHINEHNPDIEKAKQTAWLYSTKLINLLNTLEKMPD